MVCQSITIAPIANVTIWFAFGGNGTGKTYFNNVEVTTSTPIVVPRNTYATIRATADTGSVFVKFTQTNPPGETTTNPFSGNIVNSGTITTIFNTTTPPPQTGFVISADKKTGDTEYTANITITKSDDLNGAVHLVKYVAPIPGILGYFECIPGLSNIRLVNGTATVQLLVNKTGVIAAIGGPLCTCSLIEICQWSNRLELKLGTDYSQYYIIGAIIAAFWLLYTFLGGRGKGGINVALFSGRGRRSDNDD